MDAGAWAGFIAMFLILLFLIAVILLGLETGWMLRELIS